MLSFRWHLPREPFFFFLIECLDTKQNCINISVRNAPLRHLLNCTSLCNYSFFKKKYLFIYFWLHWVFVAAHGLSLVAASGGYSSLRSAGFSLPWLLLLRSTGSRCVGFSSCSTWASVVAARRLSSRGLQALEHRFSSCGAQA